MAAGSQETSLTVKDLIQKSKLISEGPPARYGLLTTRSNLQNHGSVRKWTFGEQDNTMHNKILLMVGETGTGKTTLINAMVNYILGVKFTDEVWFEITEEGEDNDMSDQSKSQTSKVTMYEVFVRDNPLIIIDTPGYGDTRGKEHDKKIAENLYNLFHSDSGVKEIDAVCLVVKASDNRLSDRQQYIFDAVLSIFGKDIKNNIFILITHSHGFPPENALNAIINAEIPCRKDEENKPEHFLLNNCQSKKRSLKYKKTLQTAWEKAENILADFFHSLKEQNRKSLEQTECVLSESKRLEGCISNLQNRIDFAECKSKELAQIQKALQENREMIKRNVNFTFTVTEHFKVKVPIENVSWWDRKATTCSVCEENCHEYGCWFAGTIWRCQVMKHGHCTSCTGKCCYSKHVKENKKYVTRSKEVTKSYEAFKQQNESSKKQKGKNLSIENRLKNELRKNEKEKSDLVEEAYRSIMKLCEIALKPDSAFIIQCLDFLIPRAEEIGKQDYARKLSDLREIKPESQERVHSLIGYFNKLSVTCRKLFQEFINNKLYY